MILDFEDIAISEAKRCGRKATTVEYFNENSIDEYAYSFSPEKLEANLSPWLIIHTVEKLKNGEFMLFHCSGEFVASGSDRIFVSNRILQKFKPRVPQLIQITSVPTFNRI